MRLSIQVGSDSTISLNVETYQAAKTAFDIVTKNLIDDNTQNSVNQAECSAAYADYLQKALRMCQFELENVRNERDCLKCDLENYRAAMEELRRPKWTTHPDISQRGSGNMHPVCFTSPLEPKIQTIKLVREFFTMNEFETPGLAQTRQAVENGVIYCATHELGSKLLLVLNNFGVK